MPCTKRELRTGHFMYPVLQFDRFCGNGGINALIQCGAADIFIESDNRKARFCYLFFQCMAPACRTQDSFSSQNFQETNQLKQA